MAKSSSRSDSKSSSKLDSESKSQWQRQLNQATRHLRRADARLSDVIDRVGPCTLKPQRDRFKMLARSIVSQQISVHAARAILGRLEAAVEKQWTAERCGQLTDAELKTVGISGQKAKYLRDLCRAVQEKQIRLTRLQSLTDDQIIEMFTVVHGIGRWTVEMFLIFSLGRLDVFPVDDLGIRKGIQALNGLPELPKARDCHPYGEHWRPFASIASWYCWRIDSSIDFC